MGMRSLKSMSTGAIARSQVRARVLLVLAEGLQHPKIRNGAQFLVDNLKYTYIAVGMVDGFLLSELAHKGST